jgi:hypothetical protein
MLKYRTLIAAVVVIATCLIPAAATAASYDPGEATCYTSAIFAKPPGMAPSSYGYSFGSTTTIGGTERLAFRANLAKLVAGRWYTVQYGRWTYKDIALNNAYDVSYSDNTFYDWTTHAAVSGTTIFTITTSGTYAVFYNMYWVATGESVADWAVHLDARTNAWDLGYHQGCQY